MITKLKTFWRNFRFNHHNCNNNAEMIDNFQYGNESYVSQMTVYKCKICGKKWDIQ